MSTSHMSKIHMRRIREAGFTLIELTLVVAIMGILAAVSIPWLQQQLNRSKVTESMMAAGACKSSITEFNQVRRYMPSSALDAGCGMAQTSYIDSLSVSAGAVTIRLRNVDAQINGYSIRLTPTTDADASVIAGDGAFIAAWHCGTDAPAVAYIYVPVSCRQPYL